MRLENFSLPQRYREEIDARLRANHQEQVASSKAERSHQAASASPGILSFVRRNPIFSSAVLASCLVLNACSSNQRRGDHENRAVLTAESAPDVFEGLSDDYFTPQLEKTKEVIATAYPSDSQAALRTQVEEKINSFHTQFLGFSEAQLQTEASLETMKAEQRILAGRVTPENAQLMTELDEAKKVLEEAVSNALDITIGGEQNLQDLRANLGRSLDQESPLIRGMDDFWEDLMNAEGLNSEERKELEADYPHGLYLAREHASFLKALGVAIEREAVVRESDLDQAMNIARLWMQTVETANTTLTTAQQELTAAQGQAERAIASVRQKLNRAPSTDPAPQ